MKSVIIYYFSGTGNTKIVADMIKKEFTKNQYNVDVIRIEDVLKDGLNIDIEKYDLIGIGCPVIAYSTPNIVSNFIRRLPNGNHKKAFIFRTAGGVAPVNYNASKTTIRKLERKGYEVFYERVFSIGSNWIVRFDDKVVKQLFEATGRKAAAMCGEITDGKRRILKTGIGLRIRKELMMHIIPLVMRLVGKDLIVNGSCSHCGICIKNCPAGNIIEKNGKVRFKLSCNSCMRCVYSCPKGAINFRFLKFFPVPGGYNIEKILKSPCEESVQTKIPPFFNGYIQNDEL